MSYEQQQTNRVQVAIDDSFSDVIASSTLYHDVLAQAQGTKHQLHRLSFAGVLAALLVLCAAVAIAAGMGLFGRLSQEQYADGRLPALEDASTGMNTVVMTQDGITIAIQQAYYDGTRVFISYKLSGELTTLETHEGTPTAVEWLGEYPNEQFTAEDDASPAEHEAATWLNGDAPRWVSLHDASIHDGLFLMDGTYLDIIGGEEILQADGSYLGWKECEMPAAIASDELQVKAVLFRGTRVIYQDGDGYKIAYTRDKKTTDIPFMVKVNSTVQPLSGKTATASYTAQATMTFTPIDLKGEIELVCPSEWVHSWEDWDYDGGDTIHDWRLYAGDALVAAHPEDCEVAANSERNTLAFRVVFRHTSTSEDLRLVPVYRDSGEHIDEGITLKKE